MLVCNISYAFAGQLQMHLTYCSAEAEAPPVQQTWAVQARRSGMPEGTAGTAKSALDHPTRAKLVWCLTHSGKCLTHSTSRYRPGKAHLYWTVTCHHPPGESFLQVDTTKHVSGQVHLSPASSLDIHTPSPGQVHPWLASPPAVTRLELPTLYRRTSTLPHPTKCTPGRPRL